MTTTRPRLTVAKKLEIVRLAVYSSGDTITPAQALSLIAGLFAEDPKARIDPQRLPELLALVTPPRPRRRRQALALR